MYNADSIFERKLQFLLPFYVFTFDKVLQKYRGTESSLPYNMQSKLIESFGNIYLRLTAILDTGGLERNDYEVILNSLNAVNKKYLSNYQDLQKEVEVIMYEALLKTPREEAMEEGIKKGRREGKKNLSYQPLIMGKPRKRSRSLPTFRYPLCLKSMKNTGKAHLHLSYNVPYKVDTTRERDWLSC